jgi:predicted transcriptional regulator
MSEFSRRERQILDILFELNEASATQIRTAMNDAPSDATVRTILRILEEKGAVTHRRDGKKFVYRPKVKKTNAGKSALKRVLNVFYDGSLKDALAAHLSDPKTKLDEETIENLKHLIEVAESRSSKSNTKSKSNRKKDK